MEWSSFNAYLEGCAAPPRRLSEEPLPLLGCIGEAGGCTACVSVCPQGANLVLEYGKGSREILHRDALCVRCGRCAAACPFDGDPAKQKFTLFSCADGYGESRAAGFLPVGKGCYLVRYGCMQQEFVSDAPVCAIPLEYATLVEAAAKQLGI